MSVGAAQADSGPIQAAAGSCYGGWHDENTYGEGCKGYPSGYRVQASAQCKNGSWAYGNKVSISGSSYSWSYAYCAGKGGYKLGTGGYVILGPA
ncbi:hypothetical protein [Saccharothrix syringae]|uniref:Lactococcin 972 family bacteriocin n=1 Tax=Saccharothrix syringae TaxID=103733 RepID=A0A5Q0GYW1_SACSY|nr:hypothetical protein [Saccharothrix syringae]QFZ18714.1 hypothetical protein EKG83_15720 [Saccharothrix syringae]